MKYESEKTEKGNVGVSWVGQEEADQQAVAMDNNGCINCYNCSYCSYCSGILKWDGPEVTNLFGLNGLKWPIAISNTHIQIGCQNHTIEDWFSYSTEVIERMEKGASGYMDQYKQILTPIINIRKQTNDN